MSTETLNRWRLVLGKYADQTMPFAEGTNGVNYHEMDDLMDFLYGREYGEDRGVREGSLDPSTLTVPEWIVKIRNIFPVEVIEKLEDHALERYEIMELLTDKEVLEKLEPNMALLKNILAFKGRMTGEVLHTAREIVKKVVEELKKKLESEVKRGFGGKKDSNATTVFRCSKNFDFKRTIRKNLKNYDKEKRRIILEKVYFNQTIKRYNPWEVIICVDESGSMMESVIYSAIIAGIFASLPMLRVKLVIFDTEVVDLSGYVDDPVETLMSVQLGGGTNIGKALTYCEGIIGTPHKTIMVLVSDLCDGAGYREMYTRTASMIEAGAKFFVLTAFDQESQGYYDKNAAAKMKGFGAIVGAVTPGKLAEFIGEVMG